MIVTYQPEDDVWYLIEPFIKRGLDRGSDFSLKDVYDGWQACRMQIWAYRDDAIRAVLVTYINKPDCILLSLSGEGRQEWLPYLKIVEHWASGQGCDRMVIWGRKGWSRVLGYRVDEVGELYQMSKAL